ncbi:hypothetical protein ACFYOC_12725 [Nocardiopsis alba]|uniref:hypothetical protein n=1 Tax=Nocardiopsis TaxID=2013 RepID=UPI002DBD0B23|nr:hypothetical protein [Nocardiopsis sp. LDBS1602]MEC3894393.1 hypothetical protein [Nocardiopsis sp. LDBS1602]
MVTELGPLDINRRSGKDPILADGEDIGTLGDFWSWACSDLVGNTMRGTLAEYLVATALGAAAGVRTEWDAVDVRTPEQWLVEVKSAAYLQSWKQDTLSRIAFSIAPATGWDAQTGSQMVDVLRHADVYVFCLLHHKDKQSLDPLDLSQWTFFVLTTRVLDEHCLTQKTITLSSLLRLQPMETDFSGLRKTVAACFDDYS